MFKIGLSINKPNMNAHYFEQCAKAGVDCIELSPAAEDNAGLDVAGI